jgi:hypothetical protein
MVNFGIGVQSCSRQIYDDPESCHATEEERWDMKEESRRALSFAQVSGSATLALTDSWVTRESGTVSSRLINVI